MIQDARRHMKLKDGNASMPEQIKRPNPWKKKKKMMMMMTVFSETC
jgi:predicted CopG family antitoxin